MDPKDRKEAYEVLLQTYQDNASVLGEIYRSLITDWNTEYVELRKYPTSLSVRNLSNDIEDNVVEVLLKVCKKNQGIFQRYFALKAKKLKLTSLTRYDIYAPVGKSFEKMEYPEAATLILDTFRSFSPRFSQAAEKIFQAKHIDSVLKPQKYTGAYCYAIAPKALPYILLNYTGDFRSVTTLAHELGHGVHDILAGEKQNVFHFHASLPLAETASTFAETLLIEKLQEIQPAHLEYFLFTHLDDLYASVLRQIYFVMFELKAHDMISSHASLDDLSKVYLEQLREQFGKKVEVSELFKNEWLYIPHIYQTPFYCYAYTFGNLLALALYQTYREHGEVSKLLELFSSGGCDKPSTLLKKLGFDITEESFWQKGFDYIASLVDSLEKTVK